jgi:hypothetical protein
MDLDAIEALRPTHEVQVESLPRHPSVTRDIAVLLDESSLVERGAGQAGFDARVVERVALWHQFCQYHHTRATVVDLLHPERHPLDLGTGLAVSGAA